MKQKDYGKKGYIVHFPTAKRTQSDIAFGAVYPEHSRMEQDKFY
jgi:hypothetical protein